MRARTAFFGSAADASAEVVWPRVSILLTVHLHVIIEHFIHQLVLEGVLPEGIVVEERFVGRHSCGHVLTYAVVRQHREILHRTVFAGGEPPEPLHCRGVESPHGMQVVMVRGDVTVAGREFPIIFAPGVVGALVAKPHAIRFVQPARYEEGAQVESAIEVHNLDVALSSDDLGRFTHEVVFCEFEDHRVSPLIGRKEKDYSFGIIHYL